MKQQTQNSSGKYFVVLLITTFCLLTLMTSQTVIGITINDGETLDLNGWNGHGEMITVQGSGVDGKGAIINTGPHYIYALSISLAGNTTFGGAPLPSWGTGTTNINWGGYSIRADSVFTTNGGSYNLTKVAANEIAFMAASIPNAVDASLANIYINQGHIGFQTSTNSIGDPTKTVFVNGGTDYTQTNAALDARASLNFYNSSAVLYKQVVLNGGTIWAESGDNSTSQNRFQGPITLTSLGGVIDVGGNLMNGSKQGDDEYFTVLGEINGPGGLRKHEDGTLIISGLTTYAGDTHINAGEVIINTPIADGTPQLNNVTSGDDLGITNIDNSILMIGTNTVASNVGAKSLQIGTLRISTGSKLTVTGNPAGPNSGIVGGMTPVPEPSTWAMLMLAAMGLGIYRRRC